MVAGWLRGLAIHFIVTISYTVFVERKPDERMVEEKAERYIEHIGEDGLILSSGCEIPFDIPVQNIYALKKAIIKYGTF